jgi:hypothetical protein
LCFDLKKKYLPEAFLTKRTERDVKHNIHTASGKVLLLQQAVKDRLAKNIQTSNIKMIH